MSYWSYRSYRGVQDCQCGNRRLRRTQRPQRRQRNTETGGVLPPAGLPVCFGNHKGHEGHKASGAGAPRRTERAGATRQTFHGHGERRTERPYGATGEAVAQSGGNRKGQASKPLNFQTSTKGARPARGPVGAWRASHATLWGGALTRPWTEQEMQEIQEIQERPCGATERYLFKKS